MDKKTVIRVVGGTVTEVARELGVTASAVSQWPDDGELPESAQNRVLAWLARKHLPLTQILGESCEPARG